METMFSTLEFFSPLSLTFALLGCAVLGIAALIFRFEGAPLSYPIVLLLGSLIAFAGLSHLPRPSPLVHKAFAVHLTELGVILSLMGVGLKIDRVPGLFRWEVVWRLLGVSMLLTIAATAFLSWWVLGLHPAAAVLLGVVLSPTDPVLAADVQVGEPDDEEDHEVRFALTAEAGMNDALAFPFTYFALRLAGDYGNSSDWFVHWLLIDVGYRLTVGICIGILLGMLLARILLRLPMQTDRQRMRTGVGALAATFLIYGSAEILEGYGFLAVIVGALVIRHQKQADQAHRSLHIFAEQCEQLLMAAAIFCLGGALAGGILAPLTWEAVVVCVAFVLIVRPFAGMIGLIGCKRVTLSERCIISFFGVRGIGSFFYLAYALHHANFSNEDYLWAVTSLVVVISIFVHGILAAPVVKRYL